MPRGRRSPEPPSSVPRAPAGEASPRTEICHSHLLPSVPGLAFSNPRAYLQAN